MTVLSNLEALPLLDVSTTGASLRVAEIAGSVWFEAASLAPALEYLSVAALTGLLAADEHRIELVLAGAGQDRATLVSESGFFRAVHHSKAAASEALRLWVAGDVIPKVRQTGQYRLHQEALALGVSLDFSREQWEFLKLRPAWVEVMLLSMTGYNSVEITRLLNYNTPSGITVRKQIERLRELGYLPPVIEPRITKLERAIKAQRSKN